uniref:DNA damage induced apoptosis suppressor n=1 Tax=Rhinolophus ferrumequinum TaxID=59479 RepID=A0A671G2H8_RHIFE
MNKRRKFLLASVLGLQSSSFIYPACQKCYSRIILLSKRILKTKLGKVQIPITSYSSALASREKLKR